VRPFVLRRRKQDVLPDLPVKTEELCMTELLGEQKSLYRHVASQQALPLIQQLKDETAPIPYMHIFALISSLKQICNHPATYLKDLANFERYESGKWEAFVELVEEAMESEQKVVVFSQYLGMLDIMKAYFDKQRIGYAEIRGVTKQRGHEVKRFGEDPKCRIFLGSLQAAGLGIDLTPASVVIHYDRWWNAARENQATDRVHRFGQMRGVQVFKMVTKESIEERIDRMIARKSGMLEDVVFYDDHQIVKRLTRGEIISLLTG
jgi:SNF2 family DNA or RNA helicase